MDKNNNHNNMEDNDEIELEGLLDRFKSSKLEKVIKRVKWHSIFRNALISSLVVVFILVIGTIVNRNLNYKLEWPTQIAVDSFNQISAPNKYIGKVSRYHNFLGGKNRYTTYKIIEGKVVFTGEEESSYGLFRDERGNWIGSGSPLIIGTSWDTEFKLQTYNELGQREMVFYYPFIDYLEYKDDLQLLKEIDASKIMEVALSFDKGYSMEEAKAMLPKGITLAWYWMDDMNQQEKEEASKIMQYEADRSMIELKDIARIRSEHTAYGIKAYDNNGEVLEDPLKYFTWGLEKGREYKSRYQQESERIYNNIVGEDGVITQADIRIWGVVVTGSTESLSALKDLPFIKASSIGVVTDKY